MKKYTLIYTDEDAAAIEAAFAKQFNHNDTTTDPGTGLPIPNPKSKSDLVLEMLELYVGDITYQAEFDTSLGSVASPKRKKATTKTKV